MRPSSPQLLSSTSRALARRPNGFSGAKRDPFDLATLVGPSAQPFDFSLTRPTLLKMEKQRQILHYLRLEQLQFNDLVAFRQPFTPPPSSHCVQVRHQHYQGEVHPGSRKVTVSVPISRLPLSSPEARHKFKLLAGPRWTPPGAKADGDAEGEIKISCEMFPSERMNEKWCSDTLDKLVKEAENKADPMTDIPLDPRPVRSRLAKSRAHKRTIGLKDFPKEWLPKQPAGEGEAER
ncbi:SPOSA6832_01494 [Sporobolomyces salmonicolor]|uniref:SPOSA6832_01494-mRNA-1:cds n=1 Tax=Sporidiobolus salmonicolor TaxID=5005 RepID=A0A0D6EIR1_SPOSA|nr:SPOSA6832_01494 [Sporobolomyces salmonicolor]